MIKKDLDDGLGHYYNRADGTVCYRTSKVLHPRSSCKLWILQRKSFPLGKTYLKNTLNVKVPASNHAPGIVPQQPLLFAWSMNLPDIVFPLWSVLQWHLPLQSLLIIHTKWKSLLAPLILLCSLYIISLTVVTDTCCYTLVAVLSLSLPISNFGAGFSSGLCIAI